MRIEGKGVTGGSVNEAAIDDNGDLHTFSHARPSRLIAADKGSAFWLHSDFVPLTTTASFSGSFYIKNTSTTKEIHVANIRTCSSGATVGFTQYNLIKDPTTGTLITSGTTVAAVNSKFESTTPLEAIILKGADAQTVTDGTLMGTWINGAPGHSVSDAEGTIIIGPGHSIALTTKPSVAMDVCTTWQVWSEVPN